MRLGALCEEKGCRPSRDGRTTTGEPLVLLESNSLRHCRDFRKTLVFCVLGVRVMDLAGVEETSL